MFQDSVRPKGHLDIETIAGVTTDLLRANYSLLYCEEKKPMIVFPFKKNVLDQNPLILRMVRMLRPPKFAWIPATRDQIPEYTSAGGCQKYDKKIDKINRINSIFDKLNKPNWASVGFQLMGLTRLTTPRLTLLGRNSSSTTTTFHEVEGVRREGCCTMSSSNRTAQGHHAEQAHQLLGLHRENKNE